MRASVQEQRGGAGVHEVAAKFERIGWGTAQNPDHDLGTDLYLAPRDERLVDLAMIAGAQVKAGGRKYFREAKLDKDGQILGWWYRESKRDHFDYWINHHAPHFLVLHDLDADRSYWVLVTREEVTFLKKGAKILVPANQIIDADHVDELLDAVSSHQTRSSWEGSSWTGATNLSPTHVYRYALLVPRLVAPHPNVSVKTVTAAQAISLVMLGRSWRYRAGREGDMPDLKKVDDTWPWEWQLVAGLYQFITTASLDGLAAALDAAVEPHQQSASAVVLAAAQIEDSQPQAAAETTRRILEQDHLETTDYGWVRLQHARALFEDGQREAARAEIFDLINLSSRAPTDVTAAAISGAAANLLFAVADWEELDFGKAISASDTAAAWWRQQITSQGLGRQADENFKIWAHDTTAVHSMEDAWDDLRAASLMAGFLGDHTGWRGALGRLARYVLSNQELADDHAQIRSALQTLLLAGADKNITVATRWLIANGPASVVKEVADNCHPERSTTSTIDADLALLTTAGDLLDPAHAISVTDWAMATFDNPKQLTETLHIQADVQSKLATLLSNLVAALPTERHQPLLAWALTARLETPGLTAGAMRDLILAIPAETWTLTDAELATRRAGEDPDRFKYALLRAAATHLPDLRQRLATEALAGSSDALWALGPVTNFDDDLVTALITTASEAIETILAGPDRGRSIGDQHHADVLALLNIWHPHQANWKPLYALLEGADEHANIAEPLSRLAHSADRLPASVLETLEPLAQRLSALEPSGDRQWLFHRDFRPAARHLVAVIERQHGTSADISALLTLLTGGLTDRQSAALLCSKSNPLTDGALMTLARDSNPNLRATAAAVLTHRAAEGDELGLRLLPLLVNDPSVVVARAVAEEAARHPTAEVFELVGELESHPSARVRAHIKVLVAGLETSATS